MKLLACVIGCLSLLGVVAELQADDLDPAVQAVRQVLRDQDVPANWLAKEPEPADPLVLAAIWHSVDDPCGAAVKKVLGWDYQPRGVLYRDIVFATHEVYEEIVLRALFGSEHRHVRFKTIQATTVKTPPNLRSDLLNAGGKVAFDRVAASLKKDLSARPGTGDVNSRDDPSRGCAVVSKWTAWDSPKLNWVQEGYAWRGVFVCTIVAGKRELSFQFIDGPSRFVITSFLDVGKRVGDSYEQIARSPAIDEYALIPVGTKQLTLAAKKYYYVSAPEGYHPTPATIAPPTAESEIYTDGLRDHYVYLAMTSPVYEHFETLHRELWELLSEPPSAPAP